MKATILTSTVSILILALSGCTQHDPNLPSYKPQAEFKESKAVIKERIVARCASKNLSIDKVTDNQVVCSTEDASFGTMLMMSSKYSTMPRTSLRYTIYTLNGKTNVRGAVFSENQSAYGQQRYIVRDNQEIRNKIHSVLVEMGGR